SLQPLVGYPGPEARRGSSCHRARGKSQAGLQQRIAAAAPAEKERILNEAVNALAKAVADLGLSVEEYDSYPGSGRKIPTLARKFVSASVLRPNSCSSGRAGMTGISVLLGPPRLGSITGEIGDADQKTR